MRKFELFACFLNVGLVAVNASALLWWQGGGANIAAMLVCGVCAVFHFTNWRRYVAAREAKP